MYFVYILLMHNGQLYTGSTSNLQNRLAEHNISKVISTKTYLPLKLLHYETYYLKSDAQRRERFLKTTEGKRLLKQQIRDVLIQFNYLPSQKN
ncbi:GIY-YIG nuclease family protein [Candidatus Falkowbacteria bacterium]|nr:GIY-YIG nuclease family protein [Candidatus Falkowbacteria bacterium]